MIFHLPLPTRRHPVYDPTNHLLREDMFWIILDRERHLAERGDRQFALLVFDPHDDGHHGAAAASLAKAVLGRVRSSDAAGWLDARRIGMLLTHADTEAARKVAESLCAQVARETTAPSCVVLVYPVDTSAGEPPSRDDTPVRIASGEAAKDLLTPAVPHWKRALDVAGAGTLLVVLSPLFLAMALYVRLVSPGPVLYRQTRIGRAGRPFVCLKFRTMQIHADPQVHAAHVAGLFAKGDAPMAKLDDAADHRLIPFAALIRASGADELPQLLNVLRGEMSLIGPRPCLPYEYEHFTIWHRTRFDTLPGLTGLWQVSGKNRTTFAQMLRYDVRYALHPTLTRDLVIFARTLKAVVLEVQYAAARRRHAA